MSKGTGSRKGSAFERKVSKELSLWWSEGADPDVFWRSQCSGGRATVRNVGQFGDIAAVSPVGAPLLTITTIELKCGYKLWSPFDAVDGACGTLDAFLEQVWRDQKSAMVPYFWLIFKRNRRETCLLCPLIFYKAYYWTEFGKFESSARLNHRKPGKRFPSKYAIVRLDEFFKKCHPKKLKDAHVGVVE